MYKTVCVCTRTETYINLDHYGTGSTCTRLISTPTLATNREIEMASVCLPAAAVFGPVSGKNGEEEEEKGHSH